MHHYPIVFKISYIFFGLILNLYILKRNGFSIINAIIVLHFSLGLFKILGSGSGKFYDMFLFLLMIYYFLQTRKFEFNFNIIFFVLFSIFYWLSYFLNDDKLFPTIMAFSDYFRFFILFEILDTNEIKIKKITFELIIIQMFITLIKLFTMGIYENVVGLVAFYTGAVATSFPILSLIFVEKYIKHKVSRDIWVMLVIGLLLISVASNKRAVWFFFPIILSLLYLDLKAIKINQVVFSFITILLFIYVGFRINPTLNPDRKIWGKFDFNYGINYVKYYTFDIGRETDDLATGRASGLKQTFKNIQLLYDTKLFWIGFGPGAFRQEADEKKIALVNSIGYSGHGSTGFSRVLWTQGIFSVLLFSYFIFFKVLRSNIKFNNILIATFIFVVFDYFFIMVCFIEITRVCCFLFFVSPHWIILIIKMNRLKLEW